MTEPTNAEIETVPSWAAIAFAIGVIAAIGGAIWMLAEKDSRGAIVAASGAVAAYLALKAAERHSAESSMTWTG